MATTLLPDQIASPAEGSISHLLPPSDDTSQSSAITEPSTDDSAIPPVILSPTASLPLPDVDRRAVDSLPIPEAAEEDISVLRNPAEPLSATDYLANFKDEATRKAEGEERGNQNAWVYRSMQKITRIYQLMNGGEEGWKYINLSNHPDQENARRTTLVDATLRIFLGEARVPDTDFERDLLRIQVSQVLFNGRGAESDEAFLKEMKSNSRLMELSDTERKKKQPDTANQPGAAKIMQENLTKMARNSAFPGRARFLTLDAQIHEPRYADIPPDAPYAQSYRLMRRYRILGPYALGGGIKAMEEMEVFALKGGFFSPTWLNDDYVSQPPYQMYISTRDQAALEYGVTTEELDDVIKHRVDAQKDDVSRDAFGTVHFKKHVVYQGVDAMRDAVEKSSLTPLEKKLQIANLPERYHQFKENLVASVRKNMPDLARDLGIKSLEDYDKISAVLNDTRWKQFQDGFEGARQSSQGDLDYALGIIHEFFMKKGEKSHLSKRSRDRKVESRIKEQISELSHLFYKEQTSLLSVDTALIGQGAFSSLESATLTFATAPLMPQLSAARYGRLATAFNAAAKVAPASTIFGIRQGLATYDQALKANLSEEEATRLGWFSGLIEGGITMTMSAVGLGGLEDINSGTARQMLRESLRKSISSAWLVGSKEFAKSSFGEVTEEQLIGLMETAIVQSRLQPGLTEEQIIKQSYDTAIVTFLASGGFSLNHARRTYLDVLKHNNAIQNFEIPGFEGMPRFVSDPSGGWILYDQDGQELGRAASDEDALTLAAKHSDANDEANADRIAYLATMLQAGSITAATDQEGVRQTITDFRPGQKRTLAQVLAENGGKLKRVAAQLRVRELMGGGDGSLSDLIFGSSTTQFENGVRHTTNRLQAGASVLTVFHEETHGFWKEALATGRITREEAITFLRAVDTVLGTRKGREGQNLRLLPEGDAEITDVHVDEAISELREAEILRTRKDGGLPPGLVSRNLSAIARLSGQGTAGKFKSFFDGIRAWFGVSLDRSVSIKRGLADGSISQAEYDSFFSKLTGKEGSSTVLDAEGNIQLSTSFSISGEDQTHGPTVSRKVFDAFLNSLSDPTARVPDSEKIHRNINIVHSRSRESGIPLDISSPEAVLHREAFDRNHRQAEGFQVRKEFIPAATEAEARAEYARRHGHAQPETAWKVRPAAAWLDGQGQPVISFRDSQERDAWREDQIRMNHIIDSREGDGPSESAGLSYEDAVKEHPFLEVMATIRHDTAKFNVKTGTFSMTATQAGRTYELKGDTDGKNIHIASLFPVGENSTKAGTNSFGSDFLISLLAYSRQMPGMTITANAARSEKMNGYAMWPKLGFEAKNPNDILGGRKIPKADAARMKTLATTGTDGPLSLIKLNSTQEGQHLWRKYGGSIDVYFDTAPESPGMLVFSRRSIRPYQRSFSRGKRNPPDQNPNLPSE